MDLAAISRPTTFGNRRHQVHADLLAFAANDHVNPRGFRQDLTEHESPMDPTQYRDRLWHDLARDLEHLLCNVNRWGDRRRADDIRLQVGKTRAQFIIIYVMRHRINEMNVVKACRFQRPRQIRDPSRWPASGDLGSAGMIIRVNKDDPHGNLRFL